MTEQPRLHHLLDRLRRGVLLEAEAGQLAGLVTELEAENTQLRDWLARCRHKPRVAELEAEVARLTAGQCTHALHMCQQHHTAPVDGCPYPKCIKARAATATA